MESVCDSDALISAIRTQEIIWNYKLKEHGDRTKKNNAWAIICAQVVENYDEKTVEEKNQIVISLQKKWKTLRDGYTRYVKKINPKNGSAALNTRPYAYYQQMYFLKKLIEDGADKTNSLQDSEHAEMTSQGSENRQNKINKGRNKRKSTATVTDGKVTKHFDEESQNSLIDKEDEDEDKLFLLSLVGEFKKIHEQYKLDAKTEILNVMRYFKGMTNDTYPSSYGDRGDRGYSPFNDYRGQWGYNTRPSASTSLPGASRSASGASRSASGASRSVTGVSKSAAGASSSVAGASRSATGASSSVSDDQNSQFEDLSSSSVMSDDVISNIFNE